MENVENSINALIEELDLAVLEKNDNKIIKIGEAIDKLLEDLNCDTIKITLH